MHGLASVSSRVGLPGQDRSYADRVVDRELDELSGGVPAISIEGAKGVGKTETARRRAASVFRLEERAQRAVVAAEPDRILIAERPVLIDEWQRIPETWDIVRRAVDDGAAAGSFLLTGSASPNDISTHSSAGRIVTVRMRPLSLAERALTTPTVSLAELLSGARLPVVRSTEISLTIYVDEIVRSGFPGLRSSQGRALRARLDGYVDRIVDRDFIEVGSVVRNPAALRRWLDAYAAATSTTNGYGSSNRCRRGRRRATRSHA